jgi:hypothetical protein
MISKMSMEEECTICFGPLAEADPDDEGDGAVRTLVCGHCFHANCIGSYRMNSFVATEGAFLTLALSRHLSIGSGPLFPVSF